MKIYTSPHTDQIQQNKFKRCETMHSETNQIYVIRKYCLRMGRCPLVYPLSPVMLTLRLIKRHATNVFTYHRQTWIVIFTPQRLYPRENMSSIHWIGSRMSPMTGLDTSVTTESLATTAPAVWTELSRLLSIGKRVIIIIETHCTA
jgi:Lon protease-like protein